MEETVSPQGERGLIFSKSWPIILRGSQTPWITEILIYHFIFHIVRFFGQRQQSANSAKSHKKNNSREEKKHWNNEVKLFVTQHKGEGAISVFK